MPWSNFIKNEHTTSDPDGMTSMRQHDLDAQNKGSHPESIKLCCLQILRPCLHGVGDPGLVR